MVNLALLEESIETIESQHANATARCLARFASGELSRHESDAIIAKLEAQMQQRIARLIQQVTR